MWPFNSILLDRIKNLERTVEILTGANQVLTEQLNLSQVREANLLDKIFSITGVNRTAPTSSNKETQAPIRVSKRVEWPKLKENLELEARKEYWAKKKEQTEVGIEGLEKEVLG